MDYLDFELEVSASAGGDYTVRVLRSPAGEATQTMRLPLDSLGLENRLQALQIALLQSGRGRRRTELPQARLVRQFGEELWDALFTEEVLSRFDVSRAEARQREMGLRTKLRINVPELAALPWEYLYDARRASFLTLAVTTPLVRYISLPQPIEPLAIVPPIRILGLIADPTDLDPLDVKTERQRLEQSIARLREHGRVELSWVPNGTWRDLRDSLRHGPWHIFHFIGHGGFDEVSGEGLIALVDEKRRAHRLSATDLGLLLGDHEPLRLALLNSCDSARADETDVFSSTAATLVRRGTPAVVAMQYEITDLAAIEFSRSFYEAIADGAPVDSAVSEGRKGVAVSIAGTLEWGTPVLFMRAPDGVLFSIAGGRAASTSGDPGASRGVLAGALAAVRARAASATDRLRSHHGLPVGLAAVVLLLALGVWAVSRGAPSAALTLSVAQAEPGATVHASGTGYQAGETVHLIVGGGIGATTVADESGRFDADVVIPDTSRGAVLVQAVGASSGRSTSGSVGIGAVAFAPTSSPPPQSPAAPSGAGPTPPATAAASVAPSASEPISPSAPPTPRVTPRPTAKPTPKPTPRPTPRPTAKPTPKPTPKPHEVILSGSVDLPPDSEVNTDNGDISSAGADLWFQEVSPAERYLVPENGARIAYFGGQAPGYSGCAHTSTGGNRVGLTDANDGDYMCVRTSAGRISEVRLISLTDTMQLHIRTWSK